ncbi:hypothetical protein M3J09_001495 [Ascochyta lentis]
MIPALGKRSRVCRRPRVRIAVGPATFLAIRGAGAGARVNSGGWRTSAQRVVVFFWKLAAGFFALSRMSRVNFVNLHRCVELLL